MLTTSVSVRYDLSTSTGLEPKNKHERPGILTRSVCKGPRQIHIPQGPEISLLFTVSPSKKLVDSLKALRKEAENVRGRLDVGDYIANRLLLITSRLHGAFCFLATRTGR